VNFFSQKKRIVKNDSASFNLKMNSNRVPKETPPLMSEWVYVWEDGSGEPFFRPDLGKTVDFDALSRASRTASIESTAEKKTRKSYFGRMVEKLGKSTQYKDDLHCFDERNLNFSPSLQHPWRRIFAEIYSNLVVFFDGEPAEIGNNVADNETRTPLFFYYLSDATIKIEVFSSHEIPSVEISPLPADISSEFSISKGSNCCACKRKLSVITNKRKTCRNCGKSFCQSCSSKKLRLPKKGFLTPVRVCNSCFSSVAEVQSDIMHQDFVRDSFVEMVFDSEKARHHVIKLSGLGSKTVWLSCTSLSSKYEWIANLSRNLNDLTNEKYLDVYLTLKARRQQTLKVATISRGMGKRKSLGDIFSTQIEKKIDETESFPDTKAIIEALNDENVLKKLENLDGSVLKAHIEADNTERSFIKSKSETSDDIYKVKTNPILFFKDSPYLSIPTLGFSTVRIKRNSTIQKMDPRQSAFMTVARSTKLPKLNRSVIPEYVKPVEEIHGSSTTETTGVVNLLEESLNANVTFVETESNINNQNDSEKPDLYTNLSISHTEEDITGEYDVCDDIYFGEEIPSARITPRLSVFTLNEDGETTFEDLSPEEWSESNLEMKAELKEMKKALKLQAYIDWVAEKTLAISDRNLDDMTKDVANMRDLAAKLPKITEEELEYHLFLRRYEHLIELAGFSLRPMIMSCPQVLRKVLKEKLLRITMGEFCEPTPYDKVMYARKNLEKQAEILNFKRKELLSKRSTGVPMKVVRNPKEDTTDEQVRDHSDIEEEAYCKLLLRKGYRPDFVVCEVEKFSCGTYESLLVSYTELDLEVERIYMEKLRKLRRMHDDSDDEW
jgi:hypothetical protein